MTYEKTKLTKKIFCLLLCLCMVVSCFPLSAFASSDDGHTHTDECVHEHCTDCEEYDEEHTDNLGEEYADGIIVEYNDLFAESAAEVSATPEEVKMMIDALPELSELEGMSDDELNKVYENAQNACDAYESLAEERQAELENEFNKLYEILTYMTTQVSPTATSINAITKIAIGAASKKDTAKGKLSGYTVVDQDLNEDASGDYIYLGYKKEAASSGFITGIVFYQTENQSESIPTSKTYNGYTYNLLGSSAEPNDGGGVVNLNNGTGSSDPRIYMYITRDVTLRPINNIYTITGKSNSEGALTNTNGVAQDLNKGASGAYIWLKVGQVYPSDYSKNWSTNSTHHWHANMYSSIYVQDKAEHTWSNGKCTVCSYSCKHSWSNGTCTICKKVCSHSWSNGKCTTCKISHSGHSWSNGKCSVCGLSCTHNWSSGTCTTCKMAHSGHNWSNGRCTVCGLNCSHNWSNSVCQTCNLSCTHSWSNGTCTVCKKVCSHTWSNGKCTVCGYGCKHSWNNGVCQTCNLTCTHSWSNGTCTVCKKVCSHSWSNGKCTVCGYGCKHDWNNGVCQTCKLNCTHNWSNSTCTVCGIVCSNHIWSKGVCTTCGCKCTHNYSGNVCTVCNYSNLNYIDCQWNSTSNKVDVSTKQINDDVTLVTSNTTYWSNGWYVVKGTVNISGQVNVGGTVHLLLCDGAKLTVKQGVIVNSGNTLYIYSQSQNTSKTGSLTATGTEASAGIGSVYNTRKGPGVIIINGGIINATGGVKARPTYSEKVSGAGIGSGGCYGDASVISGGIVTVNGGTVRATGGSSEPDEYYKYSTFVGGGAGIGGGYNGNGATVTINGGNVYAIGGENYNLSTERAMPIGAGAKTKEYNVNINDGTLKNGTGADVTLKTYTLSGITSQTRITAVDGHNYCAHDIYTLDTNKLYLYIPSDGAVTSVTTSDGQVFKPKNAGETTLYCAHAKRSNNICVHCGVYFDGTTVINIPTTENGTYRIYNLNDLIWFASKVNSGSTSISGKLMNDIDASSLSAIEIGKTASTAYSGTFDGNYKTLKVDLVSKSQYVAPFSYIKGATIKNLTVEGTITTTHKFAAGIVGRVEGGKVTLENCLSLVDIDSTNFTDGNKNDGTHGGIVAVAGGGTTTLNNCGFAGSMVGTTTRYCGGLVGWAGATVKINNSYVAAKFNLDTSESGDTFSRNQGNVTLTNCYYLNKLSDAVMSGATQKDSTKFSNGEVTYALNGGKTNGVWKQTINTDLYPNFKGQTVYYGYTTCDESVAAGYTNNSAVTAERPSHDYKNGICERVSGETHYEPATLKDGYYEIGNAGNLFWFAEYVNKGNKEANALLTADIDLENRAWTPIGRHSDSKPESTNSLSYCGTFNGDFHTISNLNVNMTNTYEAGLFSRTYGATLKNFGVVNASVTQNNTGTDGKGIRAGVIAGELHKSNVENVFTVGTITVTTKHDQAGGIAGEAAESTLRNCYTTYGNLTGKGDGVKTTATNCYYQSNSASSVSFGENKPAEQFASGEVAYLLQSANGDMLVWGQKSSEDGSVPIFTNNEDYRVLPVKSGGTTVNYSVLKAGETNGDGVVDIYDYQNAVNIALSEDNGKETAEKFDLNGDGVIDVGDCVAAQRNEMSETGYAELLEKVEDFEGMCYMKTADLNGDGVVDILDCALFEKLMSGHRV